MSLSLVHRLLGRSLSVLLVLSFLCNSTPAATLDNCWRSNRVASGPRVLAVREWLAGQVVQCILRSGSGVLWTTKEQQDRRSAATSDTARTRQHLPA